MWLARRGLDVTLVDVSDVALTRAERKAADVGVTLRGRRVDLDAPLELPPLYDLVMMIHYLNRERRDEIAGLVVESGLVIAVQQTVTNLERHVHPSRRFLVVPGELTAWAQGLGEPDLEATSSSGGPYR